MDKFLKRERPLFSFVISGVWFMVFEAEQGFCSLSDHIAENGPLSESQARYNIVDKHLIFLFNLYRIHTITGCWRFII